MTEIHWTAYVGMSTGILGSITGIAGAIMGFISYRRTSQFKKLDLRLELRKQDADINDALTKLPGLLDFAKTSRERVTSANGQTGALQHWLGEFDADRKGVNGLQSEYETASRDYHSLSDKALEDRLVESHRLRKKVDQYADKYRASLAADDKERDRIRAVSIR